MHPSIQFSIYLVVRRGGPKAYFKFYFLAQNQVINKFLKNKKFIFSPNCEKHSLLIRTQSEYEIDQFGGMSFRGELEKYINEISELFYFITFILLVSGWPIRNTLTG